MINWLEVKYNLNKEDMDNLQHVFFSYIDDGHSILSSDSDDKILEVLNNINLDIDADTLTEIRQYAECHTDRDTYQAMEGLVHNLCTLACLDPDERIWVYDYAKEEWTIYTAQELDVLYTSGKFGALSYNLKTKEVELQPITAIKKSKNTKRMVRLADTTGSSEYITYDHRCLTKGKEAGTFEYKRAKELTETIIPCNFTLPTTSIKPGFKEDTDQDKTRAFALTELFAYYLNDGCIAFDDDDASTTVVKIRMPKNLDNAKVYFTDLCKRAFPELNPKMYVEKEKNIDRFCIDDESVATTFIENCGFGNSKYHGFIPKSIMHGSLSVKRVFIRSLVRCASKKTKYKSFLTFYSKDFLQQFRLLLLSLGVLMTYRSDKHKYTGVVYESDIVNINMYPDNEPSYIAANVSNIEEAKMPEFVYDIEVAKNHNFMSADGVVLKNSRAGSQVPFSSINFGTDTTLEGRMVIKNILLATEAGLGNGETAIFPISIFRMRKGITDEGSPNYDLFKLACRVSSKRLYPNFLNTSSSFNDPYVVVGHPETLVATMGPVAGDSIITVKSTETNEIRTVTIKEFCTSQDWNKFDVWDSSRMSFIHIKNVIINHPSSDWYEITFSNGAAIRATAQHFFPVVRGDTTVRTRVLDMTVGDFVPYGITPDTDLDRGEIVEVKAINKIDLVDVSYCLETESDRFDINGINSCNCITGDTRIVLKNPSGKIIYTTASYFKRLGIGVTTLPGWKILSKDGKFVDLFNVSIRMEMDHVNAIRASYGTVKVTDNHIVPIYRKKKYMEIPAKDVKLNDCLVEASLKGMVKEKDKLKEINLIDMLPDNTNVVIVGTPKLSAQLDDPQLRIPGIDKGRLIKENTFLIKPDSYKILKIELDYYKILSDVLGNTIDEDELSMTVQRHDATMKPIPVKYKLTREFGRFYGLLCTRGFITGDNNICITSHDSDTIDFIKTCLATLLHRDEINVSFTDGYDRSIIKLDSDLFASLLQDGILGNHYGPEYIKLPNWFFFANDEFLKGFLSSVFDSGGFSGKTLIVRVKSETFAEDIQAVCSRLGCTASIYLDLLKCEMTDDFGDDDKLNIRNLNEYEITISGMDAVDMDLHDCRMASWFFEHNKKSKRTLDKKYHNEVWYIEKLNFNDYVYDFETGDHYFVAGTQRLHNCRTRVLGNIHDKSRQWSYGRGNLFPCTLNLPYVALEAKEIAEKDSNKDLIATFYDLLTKRMKDIFGHLLERFEVIAKRKAKNYPFLMGQGLYLDSEKLHPDDEIREVLKHGTLTVGFIGLAETLVVLTGKHHGESQESWKLGYKIVEYMKNMCDEEAEKTKMNFSLMGSPAEGCCGRLLRCTRDRFGVIKGVTDHEYLTNSHHIPVYYPITAYRKARLEGPFHKLEPAGGISYIELDEDTSMNTDAFEELVTYMANCDMGYFSINHPVDRDPVCGYTGIIGDTCPRCGRHSGEGVHLSKLLSLTTYRPDPQYTLSFNDDERKDYIPNKLK